MNLVLDYGNTLVKIALFRKDSILDLHTFEAMSLVQLKNLLDEMQLKYNQPESIKYAIISSVIHYPEEIKTYLSGIFDFWELNSNLQLPIQICYSTPETLGNDRIALAVAASGLYPDEDLLVIDAGTCITYDFIDKNKNYYGGGISPGISMRYKALHTFTDKLPLVTEKNEAELIGNSTIGAIQSGVINGTLAEVDGIIDRYKNKVQGIKIILTGGDIIYFDKKLKNNIFANSNLVLKGLNMILNYNVGK